ncbi:MAG: M56 family metallopeptidase, partial [Verrucomicrobiota bacterium]
VKACVKLGACKEYLYPYDVSRFTRAPGRAAVADAAKHKITAYRRVRGLARSLYAPLPRAVEVRLSELAFGLGLRRAMCAGLSAAVDVPTVVGWVRPVVLVPAAMLAGLAPAQLDALLAHELAHIRRHDFLVNLVQAVAEALFFYHPAIYAINRRIRAERENACDDIAVGVTGDAVDYARALATLEAARSTGSLALAASGDGELLARVRRLLGFTPARGVRTLPFAGAVLAASGLYVAVLLALFAAACVPASSGKLYQAETTLVFGRPANQPPTAAGTEDRDTIVKIIESRAVATRVADRLRADGGYDGRSFVAPYSSDTPKVEVLVEVLLQNRRVITQGQSRVIIIQYRHPDRLIAAKVANYYADAYLEHKMAIANKNDSRVAADLKLRVQEEQKKVADTENAIDEFKKTSGNVSLNERSDSVRRTHSAMTSKLDEQQVELNRAIIFRTQVEQYLREGRDLTGLPFMSTQAITSLKAEIASANIEITKLVTQYGDLAPEVKKQKDGRAATEQELKKAVDNAVELVRSNENNLRDNLEATKELVKKATEEVQKLDEQSIKYDKLLREKNTHVVLLQELQSRLATLLMTADLEPSSTTILDRAVPPAEGDYAVPVRP